MDHLRYAALHLSITPLSSFFLLFQASHILSLTYYKGHVRTLLVRGWWSHAHIRSLHSITHRYHAFSISPPCFTSPFTLAHTATQIQVLSPEITSKPVSTPSYTEATQQLLPLHTSFSLLISRWSYLVSLPHWHAPQPSSRQFLTPLSHLKTQRFVNALVASLIMSSFSCLFFYHYLLQLFYIILILVIVFVSPPSTPFTPTLPHILL